MFIDFIDSLSLSQLQLAVVILFCVLLVLVPAIMVVIPLFKTEYFINVYVSNTVDVVYKVTINDQVIPPATRYLEDALFNAYSYIYLRETLLMGVNPREFRTSKAVLQMLKQMNVNVHEVHIATNTGFGELYSNF